MFDHLLQEEMDRKDFIIRLFGLLLILTGVSGILNKLRGPAPKTHGYGGSSYGGNKRGAA